MLAGLAFCRLASREGAALKQITKRIDTARLTTGTLSSPGLLTGQTIGAQLSCVAQRLWLLCNSWVMVCGSLTCGRLRQRGARRGRGTDQCRHCIVCVCVCVCGEQRIPAQTGSRPPFATATQHLQLSEMCWIAHPLDADASTPQPCPKHAICRKFLRRGRARWPVLRRK